MGYGSNHARLSQWLPLSGHMEFISILERLKVFMNHTIYLDNAKHCFIPAGPNRLPVIIRIQKPYEIDTTDVSPVITVANPLQAKDTETMCKLTSLQNLRYFITRSSIITLWASASLSV